MAPRSAVARPWENPAANAGAGAASAGANPAQFSVEQCAVQHPRSLDFDSLIKILQ